MSLFTPGCNIALKLPERQYAETLAFYRDTLGLPVTEESDTLAIVDFGAIRLNLDRVSTQSQTDVWFQVETNDTSAAQAHLAKAGIEPCNEVEALPEGFDGFWIAAPSGTIHLIDGVS